VKKILFSAICTTVLGFFLVLAPILLHLALSDIASHESDLTTEWYISGVCIFILSAFSISTFVTLGFLLKYLNISEAND
jgi:hypothetical protein